jgi:hypothetical protein
MARHARIDALVFAVAVAVAVVHGFDDAYVHRQPGVPAETHHAAAILTFALGLTAAVAFPILRPGLRAGWRSVTALALTNGALHVIHVLEDGPAASDLAPIRRADLRGLKPRTADDSLHLLRCSSWLVRQSRSRFRFV